MYLGSIGDRGLHTLFSLVVDHSLEEVIHGRASGVDVVRHGDGSLSVQDDGQGIPDGIDLEIGMPRFTRLLTDTCGGGAQGGFRPGLVGGEGLAGLAQVNALSEWMEVTVWREGTAYHQRFERGEPVPGSAPFKTAAPDKKGACVRWLPDFGIFPGLEGRGDQIRSHLQTAACLIPGAQLTFADEQDGGRWKFHAPNGAADMVERVNTGFRTSHSPIRIHKQEGDLTIEIAFQYGEHESERILCFANHWRTTKGQHVDGFFAALVRALNQYEFPERRWPPRTEVWTPEAAHRGLCAVISVRLPNPVFAGAMREVLTNEEVRGPVEEAVEAGLEEFLSSHPHAWSDL
jgi:DNA gyrase subunit B